MKGKRAKKRRAKPRVPPGYPRRPTLSDWEELDSAVYWGNGP